jgi:hypothetical protein
MMMMNDDYAHFVFEDEYDYAQLLRKTMPLQKTPPTTPKTKTIRYTFNEYGASPDYYYEDADVATTSIEDLFSEQEQEQEPECTILSNSNKYKTLFDISTVGYLVVCVLIFIT